MLRDPWPSTGVILAALWLNGDPNGDSTFLLVPQLVDCLIFVGMTTILLFRFLNSAPFVHRSNWRRIQRGKCPL
jgi:hypothetical protein